MGGGGGTNTVQKSDPWAGIQPYLAGIGQYGETVPYAVFPEAMRLYQAGAPAFYPGSTVADLDANTWAALDRLQKRSYGSQLEDQAKNQMASIANGDFLYNNPRANAAFYNNNVTNGMLWADDPFINGQAGRDNPFINGTAGRDNPFINGQARNNNTLNFDTANPYLSGQVDAASRDVTRNFTNAVMPSIASQFSAGGRYGSGAQVAGIGDATNNLAGRLGDISQNLYGADWAQRQNLRASQNQQLLGLEAGAQNTLMGLNSSAQNALMGLRSAAELNKRNLQAQSVDRNNQLANNIYSFERGNQMNAIGALPGLAQLDYNNIQKQMDIGNFLSQRNQMYKDADIQRWDYNQNAPWQNLGRYSQMLQGFGGLGGTSSQRTTGGGGSFMSNALGGTMLANSLYGLGSSALGLGAGAGLAGLGSMGLGSGALFGGATGLAATGALGGVAAGANLFSTAAPLMALAL